MLVFANNASFLDDPIFLQDLLRVLRIVYLFILAWPLWLLKLAFYKWQRRGLVISFLMHIALLLLMFIGLLLMVGQVLDAPDNDDPDDLAIVIIFMILTVPMVGSGIISVLITALLAHKRN